MPPATAAFFDEMNAPDGGIRAGYESVAEWLKQAPKELLASRKLEAEHFFRRIGITFNVYGDNQGTERLIPFDIVPRILTSTEWQKLVRGLEQRMKALNAFIGDSYGDREIVAAGIVPEELILQNPAFQPEMTHFTPPAASTSTSPGSTLSASTPIRFTSSRITRARHRASPTCWRTAKR